MLEHKICVADESTLAWETREVLSTLKGLLVTKFGWSNLEAVGNLSPSHRLVLYLLV